MLPGILTDQILNVVREGGVSPGRNAAVAGFFQDGRQSYGSPYNGGFPNVFDGFNGLVPRFHADTLLSYPSHADNTFCCFSVLTVCRGYALSVRKI